jgi:hypothetical protein
MGETSAPAAPAISSARPGGLKQLRVGSGDICPDEDSGGNFTRYGSLAARRRGFLPLLGRTWPKR